MGNIIKFKTEIDADLSVTAPVKSRTTNNGGGGGNMEERVAKLESDVNAIKTDISIIKATMATDSRVKDIIIEMHSNTTKTICWLVGTMIAISGLSITIAKLIF